MDKGCRRVHSTIDKLPPQIKSVLVSMVVDDAWPDDYQGKRVGKPRYRDMAKYLEGRGYAIHAASVGRFARRIRTQSKMKEAGRMVREVMGNLNNEKTAQTQKAAAEMITAVIIEHISTSEDISTKDMRDLAKAVRDLVWVTMSADSYMRERVTENTKRASKKIGLIGKNKQIDPEVLKAIREQVYGIADERLGFKPDCKNVREKDGV